MKPQEGALFSELSRAGSVCLDMDPRKVSSKHLVYEYRELQMLTSDKVLSSSIPSYNQPLPTGCFGLSSSLRARGLLMDGNSLLMMRRDRIIYTVLIQERPKNIHLTIILTSDSGIP